MSQLLITKNALMHLESRIGDKAECEVNITEKSLDLSASYNNKIFIDSIPFQQFFQSEKTSGQWLREFEKNACDFFAGNEKN